VDEDDDGKINFLVISVPIDVVEVEWSEQTYLYAELRNSLGPEIIQTINESVSIGSSYTGTIWADLEFNGRLINASLIDGPYDVYIELVYGDGSSWPTTYHVVETYIYATAAYDYDDFETPPTVPTFVHIDAFGDSAIDIMLYCFTRTTNWGEWLGIKEALAYKVKEIVEGAGTAFAFPSRSLYVEVLPSGTPELFVPPGDGKA